MEVLGKGDSDAGGAQGGGVGIAGLEEAFIARSC